MSDFTTVFLANAHQFRASAGDYALITDNPLTAAGFANRGFSPTGAAPWIDADVDADIASHYANQFKTPAEAVADLNRRR